MTFFWTVIGLFGAVSWIFSMVAAFLFGQMALVRQQAHHREQILGYIGDLWERLTSEKGKENGSN